LDWHELNKKRVADLRDMIREHKPTAAGITQMKKEELVGLLADALGIEPPKKVIEGIDKQGIKARIRRHKDLRDEALSAGDHGELKKQRRAIHHLKRRLRKAASLTT
jgi:hypothetical protein